MKGGEKSLNNVMHAPQQNNGKKNNMMDFSSITPEVLIELKSRGVTPQQIAELAIQQGQKVPPIVIAAIEEDKKTSPQQQSITNNTLQQQTTEYREMSSKPIVKRTSSVGYVFSDLLNADLRREVEITQGSFLIGVNIIKLFKDFKSIISPDKTLQELEKKKKRKNILVMNFLKNMVNF